MKEEINNMEEIEAVMEEDTIKDIKIMEDINKEDSNSNNTLPNNNTGSLLLSNNFKDLLLLSIIKDKYEFI